MLGVLKRIWSVLYSFGYQSLRGATWFLFRPIFHVRRLGPVPRLPTGGYIVCANHGSYLDPAFVQLVMPRRIVFMMTNAFYELPGARWFFKLVCAIPVDSGRLAHQGLRKAIELVRAGRIVGIFPEGRLTRDGTLGSAQRGLAILARMTGAPVVPLAIAGSREAWPHGARRPRRADVRVAFGRPLRWPHTGNDHDRDDEQRFADKCLQEVATALEGIARSRLPPRGRF